MISLAILRCPVAESWDWDKVGWVTTDNASNNPPMMEEFATWINRKTNDMIFASDRHIRYVAVHLDQHALTFLSSSCVEHVINLATQALIKNYSPAKCYDLHAPDAHMPDTSPSLVSRDLIGIVRAICVKASIVPRWLMDNTDGRTVVKVFG